jgi:hypothetical protein
MPPTIMEYSGVTKYLTDVVDSTKQLVDDLMDYTTDLLRHGDRIQRDVVQTTRKVFLPGRDDAPVSPAEQAEVEQLRARVAELSARLAELGIAESA